MSKSTGPITYVYEVEGHEVAVTRRHVGTAYARNGNVGNPTEYFEWEALVDGKRIGVGSWQRAVAYEAARAHILGIDYFHPHPDGPFANRARNVRPYTLVADEMKANYRRRIVA